MKTSKIFRIWRNWEIYFWVISGINLVSFFYYWQDPVIQDAETKNLLSWLFYIQLSILLTGLSLGKTVRYIGFFITIPLFVFLLLDLYTRFF